MSDYTLPLGLICPFSGLNNTPVRSKSVAFRCSFDSTRLLSCALMVLVIDNYDSFTYNLVQYLGEMQVELQVHRNDQITLDQIHDLKPERILISPGPCSPRCARDCR